MREQKIKVLNFMISDTFGGIETYLSGAYKIMDKEKIQMEFVAEDENADTVKMFRGMGAVVHIISSPKNIFAYKRDIRNLFDNEYDIAYFHKNSAANIIPIKIAAKRGCKIIVHSHNVAPSYGNLTKLLHYINRARLNKLSDCRLACSTEAQRWLFDDTKGCRIINNGVDTLKFKFSQVSRNKIRKELKIADSDYVVGCVGRFVDFKNQRWILENIDFMTENVILLMVGDGEKLEACKSMAKCIDHSENIVFTGERTDVAELLCAMDVFIMPSIYEGFGIAAIEAQASGILTYVSDRVPKSAIMTDCAKTFSLDGNGAEKLQKVINDRCAISLEDRERYCDIVKQKGFDMTETFKKVEYIIRELCND